MKIVRTSERLRQALEPKRRKGLRIGLVPTMGYFHEGHLSLIRKAKQECDVVVVSLFVNPLQFGPKEDLAAYPRNFKRDSALAACAKADLLFAPVAKDLYGEDHETYVEVGEMSQCLCGKYRPGHFRGVATVVAKLFNIVEPDAAYFGQKDYQQTRVIRQMTKDLSYDISIRILPTIRETDGLAMSSRNVYLSSSERKKAALLYEALRGLRRCFLKGERHAKRLETGLRKRLCAAFGKTNVEYAELRDAETLGKIALIRGPAVAAVRIRVGRTKLIDNIILKG